MVRLATLLVAAIGFAVAATAIQPAFAAPPEEQANGNPPPKPARNIKQYQPQLRSLSSPLPTIVDGEEFFDASDKLDPTPQRPTIPGRSQSSPNLRTNSISSLGPQSNNDQHIPSLGPVPPNDVPPSPHPQGADSKLKRGWRWVQECVGNACRWVQKPFTGFAARTRNFMANRREAFTTRFNSFNQQAQNRLAPVTDRAQKYYGTTAQFTKEKYNAASQYTKEKYNAAAQRAKNWFGRFNKNKVDPAPPLNTGDVKMG
ncbi:hypothetical protein SYNPS1DRAFT_29796 [Syncephalis pseudoplumigaleata]|uniref:Uncharacterized protein n=1 Tax=Syncephalis pseudoplumigaleata TaxID=1712513 RepID=A0A4P9YWY0_9FUNG|nr:hypothetical protein SYNPS1DRAFT_29796 [Syncephalis pseudoplumigaleata]|eukprot:RKP24444.1 hypothetical protein SYNPS1DRAFT_29796 [Syncephalis pseudoplumigaleata]